MLIECKNVDFSYDGKAAVSGLEFNVNEGDYLCIVGENGSGKSTLIKGLLRLKTPSKGEIKMGGGLRANEIGYLPQQTVAQKDFPASVFEIVLSGRLGSKGLIPFYSKIDRGIALKNMEKLGITDLKNRCYRELSGGQQQRVLLARALCATKKLLLLDEPATGLDPLVTNDLYTLIKKLNTDGTTIIMVSHDIDNAVKYASHILHLRNSQIFFGKTADYLFSDICKTFVGG
jgi:zinc transport system ATP-binding protein